MTEATAAASPRQAVKGAGRAASKAGSTTVTYYEQYYKLFETNTEAPPLIGAENYVIVHYKDRGQSAAVNTWDDAPDTNTVWADAGEPFSYDKLSKLSTISERWAAPFIHGGSVTSAATESGPFWHQYKPTITLTGTDKAHATALLAPYVVRRRRRA